MRPLRPDMAILLKITTDKSTRAGRNLRGKMSFRRRLSQFKPIIIAYSACTYLLLQAQITLAERRDRGSAPDPTHGPTPPARLRWRVHGGLDRNDYIQTGKALAQNIRDLCSGAGRDFSSFNDILDFGSGCGRVIQNFRDPSESHNLYATDIDPDLVDWGKNNLSGIHWSINDHLPPLPFDDDAFDLIYGISVFTHLDEDLQHAWLRELQRVARPGATLILTVHGKQVMNGLRLLDDSYQDEIRDRGFAFLSLSRGRLKADGFPDFYQTAFHTETYVRTEWSTHFDVIDYVERGIGGHQDAVILRKR
ncbi:class I SAM-dependent methyltransferase [Mycobacterium sp. 050272]|uniref:class I SAM-dependent methyltransferase n=1 Tax=Mycobacterium sp. 050272 TaxID=3142488 RepID=UPI003199DEFD